MDVKLQKNGDDTLYPGIVEIDEDAREEYWITIRKKPDSVHLTKLRSEGKYSKAPIGYRAKAINSTVKASRSVATTTMPPRPWTPSTKAS